MRAVIICSFMFVLLVASPADARGRRRRASLSDAQVLAGSPAALATENRVADEHSLPRYADAAELRAAVAAGKLVRVADAPAYYLDETLGEADAPNAALYAHARPWVKTFLDDLAADPARPKGLRMKVTSLVRTVEYQQRLRKKYATATSATKPGRRSSHLTGSTVDISTKDMSDEGKAWLRHKLAGLERRGLVQATEEKWGSMCFHVMVFPEYPDKR